jgi:hypothetical protein
MTNYLTRIPNTKRLRDDKASGRTRRPRTAPRDEEGCEVELEDMAEMGDEDREEALQIKLSQTMMEAAGLTQ